ncbi:MAG: hypothetical protein ABSD78_14650, partial [Acidimicrobiales bacterium]
PVPAAPMTADEAREAAVAIWMDLPVWPTSSPFVVTSAQHGYRRSKKLYRDGVMLLDDWRMPSERDLDR